MYDTHPTDRARDQRDRSDDRGPSWQGLALAAVFLSGFAVVVIVTWAIIVFPDYMDYVARHHGG